MPKLMRRYSIALALPMLAVVLNAGPASALCAGPSANYDPFQSASVVFIGTASPGPNGTTDVGDLLSPAVFHVSRYLKGSGPSTVSVETRYSKQGNLIAITEDGIAPKAGERWEIFGEGVVHHVIGTSICSQSHVLGQLILPRTGPDMNLGWIALALIALGIALRRARDRARPTSAR